MKKIIKMAFLAAFVLTVGYNVYSSYSTEILSDLTLNNVEALASENSAGVTCEGNGSQTCPLNNVSNYYKITIWG